MNAFLDFVVTYVRKKIKIGIAKFVFSLLLVNIFYAKGGEVHIESFAAVRPILRLVLPQLHEHATAAAASTATVSLSLLYVFEQKLRNKTLFIRDEKNRVVFIRYCRQLNR